MPSQYEHLRVRMTLEQTRLLNWGEKVGLLEEMLEHPSLTLQLHRNVIVDILSEMQRLFKDCLKIQTKVNTVVDFRKSASVNSLDQLANENAEKATLRARAMRAWEKTMEFPTRLQWAVVKQEKFERLVEKMISYNDAMISLLDRTTIQQLYDMQLQSQLTMLQLTTRVEDLHRLALAIKVQTADRQVLAKGSPITDSDNNLARLANFKAQQLTLEMGSSAAGTSRIDRALLLLTDEEATRTLATYQQTIVWVEWKDYDSESQLPSARDMIEQRIQKLTTLLSIEDTPQEFRAPHCIGYTHDIDDDTDRYGLIYRTPSNATPARPRTLLEMLQYAAAKPSLSHRIKLAAAITSSIMYLHSVNWLHKGLRSSNIVFFTSPGQKPNYSTPIISGFEYARPDLPEELTEKPPENFAHDIYRHPDAIGRWDIRSKKSWDIYSLGVVLIEIAFWKSVSDILALHQNQKNARSKLRRVRDALMADEFLERVGAEAGEKYQGVVRRCIAGGALLGVSERADEAHPEVGAEMQRVLSELVVGHLRSIQL